MKHEHEKVTGIVLAAGFSSRMGRFKPALPFNGKPLLLHPVETLREICGEVIVVTGHQRERVEKLIRPLTDVKPVYNPDFKTGMFSSVKAGAKAVRTQRFFIVPGDIPLFTQKTCALLLSRKGDVISPAFNGKKGHPVLLGPNIRRDILAAPETEILRNILHRYDIITVETDDEGILVDFDTKNDYNKQKELR